MKDGGVAESGSHNELMKLEGLYYELATTQVRRFRTHTAIECVFHTRIVLFNDVLPVTCAVVPPGSWETAADVGVNCLPSLTFLARPLTSAEIQADPLFYLSPILAPDTVPCKIVLQMSLYPTTRPFHRDFPSITVHKILPS